MTHESIINLQEAVGGGGVQENGIFNYTNLGICGEENINTFLQVCFNLFCISRYNTLYCSQEEFYYIINV